MVGLLCVAAVFTLLGGDTDMAQAIEKHRMGTLVIEAKPGAEVRVEQLRHEFWFGATLSYGVFSGGVSEEDKARYFEAFLANFNAGVTDNAIKWRPMEPERGKVNYAIVDATLDWAEEHDIPVRGHCLFWGVPNYIQEWVKELDDDELRDTIKNRAITVGGRYRGRFAEYDLNNEMIHRNYYEERLGPGITKQMATWVKEGDPEAVLFVNDYDVLTGNRLEDYIVHIRGLLDQGVPIGGIGVQGHLHGESFDPEALQHALDELAKLGLPIRVTEFNFPGQRSRFAKDNALALTAEEEEAKAEALVEYYRICFAHPAVEGILMWGFWEGANWIPASSLFKRDWTPTPAAHAYRDLIFNEWWTNWEGKADAQGRCEVRAFYGKHRITVDGTERIVELTKAEDSKTVSGQ
jgi:endo-1,4-beta-xylanase